MSRVFVSRAGWYTVRYPQKWELEEDDTSVALFEPAKGVGVLHVSAYKAPIPTDAKKELLEHLSGTQSPARAEDINVTLKGSKQIASLEELHGRSFQKTWFISDGDYLVLATYDSDDKDQFRELADVEKIVNSIEVAPNFSRN